MTGPSLLPREYFTIVRQLGNHTDPTTYYVRAVVRNSITDAVLKVIDLEDKGDGRFLKTYQVPADVSGQGFWIDITTSVYSDSGYTTKAETYGDEGESYLVFDRMKGQNGGGGGDGWTKRDWEKLQKILREFEENIGKGRTEALQELKEGVKAIRAEIKEIEVDVDFPPPPPPVDLSPVLTSIKMSTDKIEKAIEAKEVTRETDLTQVLEAIADKEPDLSNVEEKIDGVKQAVENLAQESRERVEWENDASTRLEQVSEILGPIRSKRAKAPEMKTEIPLSDRAKRLIS